VKLKVVEQAREQYLVERAWWVENAEHKKLFAREYRDAIQHLLASPESGTIYTRRRGRVIRRWLMPKTRYHIYYRFDAQAQVIVIYSLWGATRAHVPQL
jgi:plasmid stabilization system protein ParE